MSEREKHRGTSRESEFFSFQPFLFTVYQLLLTTHRSRLTRFSAFAMQDSYSGIMCSILLLQEKHCSTFVRAATPIFLKRSGVAFN